MILCFSSRPRRKVPRLVGVQLLTIREANTSRFFQSGDHLDALPWRGPIHLMSFAGLSGVAGNVRTSHCLDESKYHPFGERHHVLIIGIRLVEFARGELGTVRQVDILIPKDSSNFKDAIETSNDELLEGKFRGDAEEEITLQVDMICYEWLGGRTTSDLIEDWCFNADVSSRAQKVGDKEIGLVAGAKHVPGGAVGNQVQSTIPMSLLSIGKACVLGYHPQ